MNDPDQITQQIYEKIAAALHDKGYFSIFPSHVLDIDRGRREGNVPSDPASQAIAEALDRYFNPEKT